MTDYSKYSENKPMDFHTEVEPDYPIPSMEPQVIGRHLEGTRPTHVIIDEMVGVPSDWHEVINCSSLNIREQPSKDSKSLQIVRAGAKLQVMAVDGVWAYVETEAGIVGYTMTKYIQV